MQPFLSQLANDFADDAYVRLKAFVTKVLHRKQANPDDKTKQVLVLQDTKTGVRIVLEADLPAESYRQLLSFDLSEVTHGPVRYDPGPRTLAVRTRREGLTQVRVPSAGTRLRGGTPQAWRSGCRWPRSARAAPSGGGQAGQERGRRPGRRCGQHAPESSAPASPEGI